MKENIELTLTAEVNPQDLLTRTGTGDQGAFSSLYDHFSSKVFSLTMRILHNEAQAEEVTQEIFLEVWQNAGKYDPMKGKAYTWIMTITHRRAVDRVRASQKSYERDMKIGIRDMGTDYDGTIETIQTHDQTTHVAKALKRLTASQQKVILLAYYEGYSQKEIADQLKLPVNTVKTRIRDGMIRLRDELGVTE